MLKNVLLHYVKESNEEILEIILLSGLTPKVNGACFGVRTPVKTKP